MFPLAGDFIFYGKSGRYVFDLATMRTREGLREFISDKIGTQMFTVWAVKELSGNSKKATKMANIVFEEIAQRITDGQNTKISIGHWKGTAPEIRPETLSLIANNS